MVCQSQSLIKNLLCAFVPLCENILTRRHEATKRVTSPEPYRHDYNQAQARQCRRDIERRFYGADGTDPRRAGRGNGRAAQACERAVQQPPQHHRIDSANLGARLWQQPRLLAQRPAPHRSVGSDAQSEGNGADGASAAVGFGAVTNSCASLSVVQ